MPIHHLAAYRFVALSDPAALVAPLEAGAAALGLKGTILVADEGINLFVAGDGDALDDFLRWLASDPLFSGPDGPAFAGLTMRRGPSTRVPYRHLRVKHRPEIVTMRRPDVRPDAKRAPAVAPATLAAWLDRGCDDAGRPVVLIDARNAFEVAHGAFDAARHLGLERFDQWPDAVDAMDPLPADATVVTYCTGGIRCEKAALWWQRRRGGPVFQLDGGILHYFETVGSAHWHGDCFVFDERIAVAPPATAALPSTINEAPPVLPP